MEDAIGDEEMELVLISENKLKIILTNDDMDLLDITCDTIDYDNSVTKRAFWELLEKAKSQTGFDVASEKIFVQVYPDKNGGCSMYVTKMSPAPAAEESYDYQKKFKTRLYAPVTGEKKRGVLFRFNDSEGLYNACRQLGSNGYAGTSSVSASKRHYYLYIEDCKKNLLSMIAEYGSQVNNPFFRYYLAEHAKVIAPTGAVELFAKLYS